MLTTVLFPFVLVLDSFMMSLAYGTNGIKVPKGSIFIISFIGTLFLSFSFLFASVVKSFLPSLFCSLLSFILLLILGITNLLHFLIHNQKKFSFHWNELHFIITIYFDELKADVDHSFTLSYKEALMISFALSFDSLLSGFGIGLSHVLFPILLIVSFLLNIISISTGLSLGKKISKNHHNYSWISAIIFFILAFCKLFS